MRSSWSRIGSHPKIPSAALRPLFVWVIASEELLARLSRELPDAIDKYTPQGRLPTETDFSHS